MATATEPNEQFLQMVGSAIAGCSDIDQQIRLAEDVRNLSARLAIEAGHEKLRRQAVAFQKMGDRKTKRIDYSQWEVGKGIFVLDEKAARSVYSCVKNYNVKSGSAIKVVRQKAHGGYYIKRVA